MFPCHSQILAEIGELRKGVEGELAAAGAALEDDAREDTEVRARAAILCNYVYQYYRMSSGRGLRTQHVGLLWRPGVESCSLP